MRAFGLLVKDAAGRFDLSPLAREHLVPGGRYDVSDYIGLVAKSPGVQANGRAFADKTSPSAQNQPNPARPLFTAKGLESAMEKQASAGR